MKMRNGLVSEKRSKDTQFSIKNSYPPTKESVIVSEARIDIIVIRLTRTHNMRIKVIGDSHIDFLLQICHKWCCYFWNRVRADASLNGSRQMSHMFWKRTSCRRRT